MKALEFAADGSLPSSFDVSLHCTTLLQLTCWQVPFQLQTSQLSILRGLADMAT